MFLISSDLSNQITLYDENDKIARLVAFTTIQLCCVNQFRTYRAFKAELYCKYSLGPHESFPQTASRFVQMFLHSTSVWPTQRQTDTQIHRPHYVWLWHLSQQAASMLCTRCGLMNAIMPSKRQENNYYHGLITLQIKLMYVTIIQNFKQFKIHRPVRVKLKSINNLVMLE